MDGKFVLAKVNVNDAPVISGKFNVESIPTVILFKNNKPVSGFIGAVAESEVKKWLSDELGKK